MVRIPTLLLSLILLSLHVYSSNPLRPIRADNPRDTMRTFMEAMNHYRQGVQENNPDLKADLKRAISCLDLRETPYLLRQETGKEAAILIKEVIDRVIVIDYAKIPETIEGRNFWRLKNTNIRITKVDTGEHTGEWLFSPSTVNQAREFFHKIRNLPYLAGSGQGAKYKEPLMQKLIPQWAKSKTLGLYNWQWFGVLIVTLFGVVIRLLVSLVFSILQKGITKTETLWDDRIFSTIETPLSLILTSIFWYIAVAVLQLEGLFRQFILLGLQILISVALVRLVYLLTVIFSDYLEDKARKTDFPLDDQLVPLIRKTLKLSVIVLGALIAVQNLGVNVLSLLAGLGLGGLALAMAAKDTAANLFGSIMIILDKPFKVGEWIVCGDVEGIVEEIGFRSTRVRTFYNSEVSVPNAQLASQNIDNMGKRQYRRVRATLGLTYDTSPEKIEAFLEGLRNIVLTNPCTNKENFQICFHSYGDFSLNILLYLFLEVPNWSRELLERQNIFLEVLKLAEKLEIQFAFPTQTLHVDSFPEKKSNNIPTVLTSEELRQKAESFKFKELDT